MLLSRVAENLYWASRYLERAEATARVVREHTNVLVDIPTSVPLTWEPLLAITGTRELFDERYGTTDELAIIRFLVADRDNVGSIMRSVEQARENLRTTREVLPRELWQTVNDVFLYVASHHLDGVARRSRTRFLDRVIAAGQQARGVVEGTMSRDEAFHLLRLGTNLERADMTTRVLDVRAGSLVSHGGDDPAHYESVQWTSVLRSVSALQMYHREGHPVDGAPVLEFLLTNEAFPHSVTFCLAEIDDALGRLPRWELISPACVRARILVAAPPIDRLLEGGLHDYVDDLQVALGAIHDALAAACFLPVRALAAIG
jgi:uncharacterized alpha-E superfamily protein